MKTKTKKIDTRTKAGQIVHDLGVREEEGRNILKATLLRVSDLVASMRRELEGGTIPGAMQELRRFAAEADNVTMHIITLSVAQEQALRICRNKKGTRK